MTRKLAISPARRREHEKAEQHLVDRVIALTGITRETMWMADDLHQFYQCFGLTGHDGLLSLNAARRFGRHLQRDAALLSQFVAGYAPSSTRFDRDGIGKKVLEECRNRDSYTVLSAGCSTGAELYSIAVHFLEAGIAPKTMRLIGVDVNAAAIAKARAGTYAFDEMHNRNHMHYKLQEKYFLPHGKTGYIASEQLRAIVRFEQCNLLQREQVATIPEAPFTVICCRNVLKYFTARNTATVVRHLEAILQPDGALITGSADEDRILEEVDVTGFQQAPSSRYAVPVYTRA